MKTVKRPLAGILLTCLATAAVGADMRMADAMTFDRHKGKLYAVYARELKSDPAFKAELVLQIRIATDGRVINCRIVSSDAPTPGFGDTLCARVREFQFEPRDAAMTITKPLGFYPAN
jgi:periplasmic protein TonB